jgi:hypothetical protein
MAQALASRRQRLGQSNVVLGVPSKAATAGTSPLAKSSPAKFTTVPECGKAHIMLADAHPPAPPAAKSKPAATSATNAFGRRFESSRDHFLARSSAADTFKAPKKTTAALVAEKAAAAFSKGAKQFMGMSSLTFSHALAAAATAVSKPSARTYPHGRSITYSNVVIAH